MIAFISVAFWSGVSAAAEGASNNGDQDEILSLSLEELLEVELDSMAVTGIHHTHERGEWMVGYRFMHMDMHGNRDGTSNLTPGMCTRRDSWWHPPAWIWRCTCST